MLNQLASVGFRLGAATADLASIETFAILAPLLYRLCTTEHSYING